MKLKHSHKEFPDVCDNIDVAKGVKMKTLLITAIISTLLAIGVEYQIVSPHFVDHELIYDLSLVTAVMCWLGVWIRLVFFDKK